MKCFPGFEFMNKNTPPVDTATILLRGPKFSGKTTYCNNFFINSINANKFCIYISSTFTEQQFDNIFSSNNPDLNKKYILINPFLLNFQLSKHEAEESSETTNLNKLLSKVKDVVDSKISHSVSIIFDSLSILLVYYPKDTILKFIIDLVLYLKTREVDSVFTLDSKETDSVDLYNKISNLFDGLMETRITFINKNLGARQIKLISFINSNSIFQWIRFDIDKNNRLNFYYNKIESLICNICKEQINEDPVYYSDLVFHKEHLNAYKKLLSFYGSSQISEIGSSGIIYANFFFIDIVGLSNPLLSVKKQIKKIQLLNNIILSCPSFKKEKNKVILPTGDGMAIGFKSDPKLPVELSKELQNELKLHNNDTDDDSKLLVRIGIGSGNVFLVSDLNDNKNVWGPGIILARRVMDLGDEWHILMEGNIAKTILMIDEEYADTIHFIGNYQIKHGQNIDIYSVYDDNVGNSNMPSRFRF